MDSQVPPEMAALAAKKSDGSYKKRQDDAKKKQSGELPPDLDENGKMINPHNPDYITKVPWYLGESGPTLKHHSIQKVDHFLSMSEADALIQQKLSTKKAIPKALSFRKGACKNCGAMTHKEKDCVERPRSSKKSAWKSGVDIAPDEVILKMEEYGKISYDGKRDQWQGYNPEEYKSIVDKYQRIDEERRKYRQEQKEIRRREQEAKQEKKRLEKEKPKQNKLDSALKSDLLNNDNNVSNNNNNNNNEDDDEDEKHDKTTDSASDSDSDSDYDSDEDDDEEEDDTKEFMARDEEARDFQARQARQGGIGGAEMKTTG
jgi:pre-mRNA-processing factor SLU7